MYGCVGRNKTYRTQCAMVVFLIGTGTVFLVHGHVKLFAR